MVNKIEKCFDTFFARGKFFIKLEKGRTVNRFHMKAKFPMCICNHEMGRFTCSYIRT